MPIDLPARRVDPDGRVRVDARAIVALAAPLFVNSALQAVLNLTDTWFVGRISAQSVAAVGGVYWVILGVLLISSKNLYRRHWQKRYAYWKNQLTA